MIGISPRNAEGYIDLTAKKAIDNATRAERNMSEKTTGSPARVSFHTDIPPSVNHAYINTKGRRFLTKDSKAWLEKAGYNAKRAATLQKWHCVDGEKLIMELWTFWPDLRRRDTHNLHKLIADAFEGILYTDDRTVLIRDMDYCVDRHRPRVEVVVRKCGEMDKVEKEARNER